VPVNDWPGDTGEDSSLGPKKISVRSVSQLLIPIADTRLAEAIRKFWIHRHLLWHTVCNRCFHE